MSGIPSITTLFTFETVEAKVAVADGVADKLVINELVVNGTPGTSAENLITPPPGVAVLTTASVSLSIKVEIATATDCSLSVLVTFLLYETPFKIIVTISVGVTVAKVNCSVCVVTLCVEETPGGSPLTDIDPIAPPIL